jgi:hypothetical protein
MTIMPIDKKRLKGVLSTFLPNAEEGYDCSSEFVKLSSNVKDNVSWGLEEFRELNRYFRYIDHVIHNIETVIEKLEWERGLFDKDQLGRWEWVQFSEVDIDIFHVYMRSIFDYLAKIIQIVSDHPKSVSEEHSFNELQNWLVDKDGEHQEKNVKMLGSDLASLVLSVDWFKSIKNVRDNIVHRGADTMAFAEEGMIPFQVNKDAEYLISFPEIKFNENLIDFELYAGVYFGYLLAFLEEASKVIEKRLPPRKSAYGVGNPHKWYRKMPAVYKCIEKVLNQT